MHHSNHGAPGQLCSSFANSRLKRRRTPAVSLLGMLLCVCVPPVQTSAREPDVVVYGGTAAGAMAAVAAARHGVSVLLLEPGQHIGGMVSGGLGKFDVDRQQSLIGGLTLDFFHRLGRHYGQPVSWTCEPHAAEAVFNTMLREAGVEVRFRQSLLSAEMDGTRIRAIRMRNDRSYAAGVFVDATYEGDLLKAAGVSCALGREGKDRYGESLAGRRELLPGHHQFGPGVSPWQADRLLPGITPEDRLVPVGAGDGRIQAYCYRLCLTDRPENRLPITRPEDYEAARYELLRRHLVAVEERGGRGLRGPIGFGRIPNGKCDANSSGPVSLNLPGANQEYVEATPERRAEIREEHRRWAHGLLFFLQNDPSVPPRVREACAPWGLCRDEFQDTGGWPHQLYVREARRMIGEIVLTQHDLQERPRKYDVVGMAGYNIDIREVQWVAVRTFRFPDAQDDVFVEGYVSQPVEPWDIPYRALLPRYAECSNLLVPVCISASTVAYASFRMEPNYMIAGHSAGVAAALAVTTSVPVHRVSLGALQDALRADGQVLQAGKP